MLFKLLSKFCKSKYLWLGLLLLIVGVGVFVRVVNINFLRLTQDEMSIGYNAYALAKTGQDEWGRSWPLVFQAFGDWKLPAYIYTAVPFVRLLGLNGLSVKLPSIVAGSFLIVVIYEWVMAITNKKWLASIAALLMAVSPWSVHISRMALESNLALLFFSIGVLTLLKSWRQNGKWSNRNLVFWAILGGLAFGASLYSYVAYRLIVVLFFMAVWLLLFIWKVPKKFMLYMTIVMFIVGLPLAGQLFGRAGTARFSQIGIFANQGAAAQVNERRSSCFLIMPTIMHKICALVFHKPQYYVNLLASNYLSFLSPSFLFINGDELRYLNDPGFGQFVWILAPFYIWGIYAAISKPSFGKNIILAGWLIAPIPSALVGDPQIVRGSALLPFVIVLICLGINEFAQVNFSRWLKLTIAIFMASIFLFYSFTYLVHALVIYPHQYAADFFPLDKEVANYLLEKSADYDTIYINDRFSDTHIWLAFYGQMDPIWYREHVQLPTADKFGFQHPTALGKFVFGNQPASTFLCQPEERMGKMLYITNNGEQVPEPVIFKNFSDVHVEAQIIDVNEFSNLATPAMLKLYCGS